MKSGRKVTDDEMEGDPLKGINVDAAGGAGKVLKMIAEKVSYTPTELDWSLVLIVDTLRTDASA